MIVTLSEYFILEASSFDHNSSPCWHTSAYFSKVVFLLRSRRMEYVLESKVEKLVKLPHLLCTSKVILMSSWNLILYCSAWKLLCFPGCCKNPCPQKNNNLILFNLFLHRMAYFSDCYKQTNAKPKVSVLKSVMPKNRCSTYIRM